MLSVDSADSSWIERLRAHAWRPFVITVWNRTTKVFSIAHTELFGKSKWFENNVPPLRIDASHRVTWASASNGMFSINQGIAHYRIVESEENENENYAISSIETSSGIASKDQVPLAKPAEDSCDVFLKLLWLNPYFGSPIANVTVDPPFRILRHLSVKGYCHVAVIVIEEKDFRRHRTDSLLKEMLLFTERHLSHEEEVELPRFDADSDEDSFTEDISLMQNDSPITSKHSQTEISGGELSQKHLSVPEDNRMILSKSTASHPTSLSALSSSSSSLFSSSDASTIASISIKTSARIRELYIGLPSGRRLRIGQEKYQLGYRPKYPIILVPGFASSALEDWCPNDEGWFRERVWVSITKLGQKVFSGMVGAVKNIVSNSSASSLSSSSSSSSSVQYPPKRNLQTSIATGESISSAVESVEPPKLESEQRQKWLKHLLLQEDGISDPEGIRVRASDGLKAVDYMDPSAKKATTVFSKLIRNLADIGYLENKNLLAAPYDWRLPPSHLEKRDKFFTRLRYNIQYLREANEEKVLLVTHSMGFKCIHYFLWWMQKRKPNWIEKNIAGVIAIASPILGSPLILRSLVPGVCRMGLELFLSGEEMRLITRSFGSVPWLFPIGPDYHCNVKEDNDYKPKNIKALLLAANAENTWNCFQNYYLNEEYYLKRSKTSEKSASPSFIQEISNNTLGQERTIGKEEEEEEEEEESRVENEEDLPPALLPPPVAKIFCIYGINLNTEVNFYFKYGKEEGTLVLDKDADRLSNVNGLKTKGGIIYETKETRQKTYSKNKIISINRSGDGTVPFSSLNYYSRFQDTTGFPQIDILEIPNVGHREILLNEQCFEAILDYATGKYRTTSKNKLMEGVKI